MQTKTKPSKAASVARLNDEAQVLLDELKEAGYGALIGKKQYAEIVGCSLSAVDTYISKGYGIPCYRKLGHQRNAKVLFSLRDVAEYLTAQTVQTA